MARTKGAKDKKQRIRRTRSQLIAAGVKSDRDYIKTDKAEASSDKDARNSETAREVGPRGSRKLSPEELQAKREADFEKLAGRPANEAESKSLAWQSGNKATQPASKDVLDYRIKQFSKQVGSPSAYAIELLKLGTVSQVTQNSRKEDLLEEDIIELGPVPPTPKKPDPVIPEGRIPWDDLSFEIRDKDHSSEGFLNTNKIFGTHHGDSGIFLDKLFTDGEMHDTSDFSVEEARDYVWREHRDRFDGLILDPEGVGEWIFYDSNEWNEFLLSIENIDLYRFDERELDDLYGLDDWDDDDLNYI